MYLYFVIACPLCVVLIVALVSIFAFSVLSIINLCPKTTVGGSPRSDEAHQESV